MTLRIPAKVLTHVWSYDFYKMTLSTGKQQRHMIKVTKDLLQKMTFLTIIVSLNSKILFFNFLSSVT